MYAKELVPNNKTLILGSIRKYQSYPKIKKKCFQNYYNMEHQKLNFK